MQESKHNKATSGKSSIIKNKSHSQVRVPSQVSKVQGQIKFKSSQKKKSPVQKSHQKILT